MKIFRKPKAESFLYLSLIVGAATTLYLSRDAYFYSDDYIWIQNLDPKLGDLFMPYNGQLFYFTLPFQYLHLKLFGISSFFSYLLLSQVLNALLSIGTYKLLKEMLPVPTSALLAGLIFYLSQAFHNQLWVGAALNISILIVFVNFIRQLAWPSKEKALVENIFFLLLLVTAGVGGFGLAIIASILPLLIIFKRYLKATALSVVFVLQVIIYINLELGSRIDQSVPSIFASTFQAPMWLANALIQTIEKVTQFGTPVSTTLGVLIVAIVLTALTRGTSSNKKNSPLPVLLFTTCLALTAIWVLLLFGRGLVEEVAAPRYLGITGALLIIASSISVALVNRQFSVSSKLYKYLDGKTALNLIAILAIALNLAPWLQMRMNASYLGNVNLAKLTAIQVSGESIEGEFMLRSDGVPYVEARKIREAIKIRGNPKLTPHEIGERMFPQAGWSGFFETLVEAKVISFSNASGPQIENCNDAIVWHTDQKLIISKSNRSETIYVGPSGSWMTELVASQGYDQISFEPLNTREVFEISSQSCISKNHEN